MYFLVQFAFFSTSTYHVQASLSWKLFKEIPRAAWTNQSCIEGCKIFCIGKYSRYKWDVRVKVLDAKRYQVVDPKENRMCIWRGQTFQICPPRTNTNPNMTRKSHSAKIGNTFHPIDATKCCIVEYSIHLKFFCRESAFISIHTWLLRWLYATQNNRISHHPFLWLRILGRVFISFMIWSKPLLGKCTKTASNCPSSSFVQSLRNFQSTS